MSTARPLYSIEIVETLYEFDEPILFVARVGFLKSLFLKIHETDTTNDYLSCYIDDEYVSALRDGRISIRGAFDSQKERYVVNADHLLNVTSEAKIGSEEIGEENLPKPGVGILPRLGNCPDVLQVKDALVSIYFQGAGLNRESIHYSTLMNLLSGVQNLVKNVIAPPELRGLRNSTFDFLVGDPALGSLMISVKEPTANLGKLRQAPERRQLTMDDVRVGVARNKDEFFSGMEEMLSQNALNDASDDVFEGVQHLLPSSETPFSNVTFSTQKGGVLKRISIDRERADAVRKAHARRNSTDSKRTGTIVEINAASRTLLLRSRAGITTCAFDTETFERLRKNPAFKIGSRMSLDGDLFERVRRDYMNVEHIILLEAAS
ncbi:MAG: hypothetical protein EOS03_23845 [Mesorhizobium sp.]|uniref:hypothetical protein n=1 Tax=Mesorhizobium sp. TaxID=1871066 RepID=UPI000FE629AA|nr:hypothetical protein [Mesorhizobium sp.]RWN44682.1 MAG: hypothetical protein EOS03_23845 [Mesorhizobium sp.]